MNKSFSCIALCFCLFLSFPVIAPAAEPAGDKPKSTRARSLLATPVNVNTAGAGSLPKGMMLTMINASFSDKTRSKDGGGNTPDVFSQSWLLKIRYGITNRFEIAFTTPYINNSRSGNYSGSKHIEGFADQVVQFTVAPLQQHQGDPLSVSFTAGILFPTGTGGKNHIPGTGAWGGRAAAAVGAWVNRDIKLDTEVVWSGPFERGNQKVKRGDQYQWNVNARYAWDNVDVGLESSLVHQESGDKRFDTGTRNIKNGYTEWFVGPSMNVASDTLGMWAGVGVFFPVMQEVKGPTKVEDARFEFKIGKVW